ncbi:DUF1302 domain-containing protein [Pelagibacteraceae bacterium]|nr:DUF1302 domain-containing protein [Pelagibacteraceae bacterium]
MDLFKSKLISILSVAILTLSIGTIASAQELNLPGFSGTVNTTITSGVSMRVERNCLSVRGTQYQDGDTGDKFAALIASEQSATNAPIFLAEGEGCAKRYTDGYGNTGSINSGPRNLISANADNGRTNFDGGDIFDITQRVYSEIIGNTDDGTSVNLSFVGTYNPVVDVNGNPEFAPFTSKQQDDIESNLTLLNAYVSKDLNMDHSVTIGRFVTSWGESTFIPIGMNGLTTNAVDLSKLRNPGASIKEALIPTEQITLEGFLSDGWSYEAYLQMNEGHVEFEEAGQFFGNEVVSGDRLIISGQFSGNDQARAQGCGYLTFALDGNACNATTIAAFNAGTLDHRGEMSLIQTGMRAAFSANAGELAFKTGVFGSGAASTFGGNPAGGDVVAYGTVYGAVVGAAMASWDEYDRKKGSKAGAVDMAGGNHIFADGEEQYGLSLRKFLPDVGTGIDLGFHFTQYDSKVPYLRMKGQQGIVAGDLLGIFTLASKTEAERSAHMVGFAAANGGAAKTDLNATQQAGLNAIQAALGNIAYGEAACGAYMKGASANALFNDGRGATGVYTDDEQQLGLTADNYTVVNGKLYHDASKCFGSAQASGATGSNGNNYNTAATQKSAAALIGAAITPLNIAEYEFIYPENLQAFGISANTNVGTTAVQLEITYRPDFPLATDGGDQGQQMSDAGGTTGLLTLGVAQGIYGKDIKTSSTTGRATTAAMYNAGNGLSGSDALDFQGVLGVVKNFKRSNLPTISAATVLAGDYYSTPYFEYDVISGTLGTTSLFAASHPITLGLGADNAVFLTEFGFVSVDGLTIDRPVARNGYRDGVGGAKCGGVTKGGSFGATNFGGTANDATKGVTHLGSGQTDPLFGNGGYCEAKNNADDFAMTYRLIGSASYNNIGNTPWNLSNSVVWSHDLEGYAPSSLGGFVPGRQSLSLSSTLTKGSVKASVSYVNQMGDEMDNLGFDMDYVSASMSYAF